MALNFFNRKKPKDIYEDLNNSFEYEEIKRLIEKGFSLLKLKRTDEANDLFLTAEKIATHCLNTFPNSLQAHLVLAYFYTRVQSFNEAEEVFEKILNYKKFNLDQQTRLILSGELQRIQQEKPIKEKEKQFVSYTRVYVCQNCGRIINYVTMPCPYCEYTSANEFELASALNLSNQCFEMPALLMLSREISNGRKPVEVVVNLEDNTKKYLNLPEERSGLKYLFKLLQQNKEKNNRNIDVIRKCPSCGDPVSISGQDKCFNCQQQLDLPEILRLLICMDNLLWLFEQRIEPKKGREFSEFVCLLVIMINDLLRKQEEPTEKRRKEVFTLLKGLVSLSDKNRGCIVDLSDPKQIKTHIVKDNMLEDTETFASFLNIEIHYFTQKIIYG